MSKTALKLGTKKRVININKHPRIYYRHSGYPDQFRVWRSDWYGDTFDIMDGEAFRQARKVFEQFGFAVIEWHDEDDDNV